MRGVNELGSDRLVERLGAQPRVSGDYPREWRTLEESERRRGESLGTFGRGETSRAKGAFGAQPVTCDRGIKEDVLSAADEQLVCADALKSTSRRGGSVFCSCGPCWRGRTGK